MRPETKYWLITGGAVVGAAGLGCIDFKMRRRGIAYLHYAFALLFLVSIIFGLIYQKERVRKRQKLDWVVALHIVIFGVLAFLTTASFLHHYRKMSKIPTNLSGGGEKVITTYKGNKYDLTDFVSQHPGGDVIKQAHNKDLEQVWKQYNVFDLHNNDEYIQGLLKKYKM